MVPQYNPVVASFINEEEEEEEMREDSPFKICDLQLAYIFIPPIKVLSKFL